MKRKNYKNFKFKKKGLNYKNRLTEELFKIAIQYSMNIHAILMICNSNEWFLHILFYLKEGWLSNGIEIFDFFFFKIKIEILDNERLTIQ